MKCRDCNGKGVIEDSRVCPDCKGAGSDTLIIGVGADKGNSCVTCRGKGKLINKSKCEVCDDGNIYFCAFCGNDVEQKESMSCATCTDNPIVVQIAQPLDNKYLEGKVALAGTITGSSQKSTFVDLGAGFTGMFQHKGKYFNNGDTVPVRLKYPLQKSDRGGKAVPVFHLEVTDYRVVKKHLPVQDMTINELKEKEGSVGRIFVQITEINIIPNGPTIFKLIDKDGSTIDAVSYGEDNERAFPYIPVNTLGRAIGRYRLYNDQDQILLYSMEKAKQGFYKNLVEEIAGFNQYNNSPLSELETYVKSDLYDKMKTDFVQAATKIRTALLSGQPITLRYHSPCVDGVVGAYAIDFAIRRYMNIKSPFRDDYRRGYKRLPHRSPIFDVNDILRDLSFVIDDSGNTKNLPLYILVDIGSTAESKATIAVAKSYGIDVIIVDHHQIAPGLEETESLILNPNKYGSDYSVTSGMLALELSKFIMAEHLMDKRTIHLGALSGFADKVKGPEYEEYLTKASENDYNEEMLDLSRHTLEYVLSGLRHIDGGEVTRNILGLSGSIERTKSMLDTIGPMAREIFKASLEVMTSSVVEETLSNNLILSQVEMENYTPRYDYPQSADLLFAFHNNKLAENEGKAIVSLGTGNTYLILRHSSTEFSFLDMLNKLQEKFPAFGITGGGHTNFGSIQFYSGHKEDIINEIKQILAS